jgi:asparagine synthase (glutamine-hydrolysing)
MRRLSIIDLSTGHQPIHNETSDIWLVFNGEIYNFKEIRNELEALGHTFYTRTDSEVIVHAYEQWGKQCFARLRGMFGIAIWDAPKQTLLLARDRFGKKPLYYASLSDGSLAFASELKSLYALPNWSRTLSGTAIENFLVAGYVPTPLSIYEDVKKLPPAHWMEVSGSRVSVGRYWEPRFLPKAVESEDALLGELERRLDEAVRVRLVSDVPFGAFLSGGIDSSLVVAMMTRHMDVPVKTFTIGFAESKFDERARAALVASAYRTEHHELVATPDLAHTLEGLAWHLDEPFADSSALPTYLVSKLAASHVKMVLSGDGGDELFGGYTRYRRYDLLTKLQALRLGGLLGVCGSLASAFSGSAGRRLRQVANRAKLPFPDSYLSGVCLLPPEGASALLHAGGSVESHDYPRLGAWSAMEEGLSPIDRGIHIDVHSYLPDDILVKVDRMTMACSLEARAPLLDHQLAEFAFQLPDSMKMRGSVGKYLLRKLAAKLLPASVVHGPKRGFAIPLAAWLRGPLRELLVDSLGSRSARDRSVFTYSVVEQYMREHLEGTADRSEPLWALLNFELWANQVAAKGGSR